MAVAVVYLPFGGNEGFETCGTAVGPDNVLLQDLKIFVSLLLRNFRIRRRKTTNHTALRCLSCRHSTDEASIVTMSWRQRNQCIAHHRRRNKNEPTSGTKLHNQPRSKAGNARTSPKITTPIQKQDGIDKSQQSHLTEDDTAIPGRGALFHPIFSSGNGIFLCRTTPVDRLQARLSFRQAGSEGNSFLLIEKDWIIVWFRPPATNAAALASPREPDTSDK